MNAVEIEEAVSSLVDGPFDQAEFPLAFLEAFGTKEAALKRLRTGASNKSDLGGVLRTGGIHLAAAPLGEVTATLARLKASPATGRARARFVLATDGVSLEAEDLASGETVACAYAHLADHVGFFLALAGITTVEPIRESAFDVEATGRLNRLYVELLKDNPDWGTAERRPDMTRLMARLIFCFFAQDTGILVGQGLFTRTVAQTSAGDAAITHEVISEIFRAMDVKPSSRAEAKLPRWAEAFPSVNGGLFSGGTEVPRFSRVARSHLLHVGQLEWKRISPDIFGSMIQALADEEERGALGMHYTSVPNILKVLNPLFLDELRGQLREAGDHTRKLLNLRNRMARICVLDPACGSGNFLVVAYKEMRAIEAEINRRRGEPDRPTDIPLTNYRGIELRDFPAEIARLALIIAGYQCDVLHRGRKEAPAAFLPPDTENWITCGNALRLDWSSVCPPIGTGVNHRADDLPRAPRDRARNDLAREGGETYICGNPPYVGTRHQTKEHKRDIEHVFATESVRFGNLDYIGCWFLLAARCLDIYPNCSFAFVSTSSLFQGEQAATVLHVLDKYEVIISWAHTSFPWSNNAANNAGVMCCIVGCSRKDHEAVRYIHDGKARRRVDNIGPYLISMPDIVVTKRSTPISNLSPMSYGSMSNDDGLFSISDREYRECIALDPDCRRIIKFAVGGAEYLRGIVRRSIYVANEADLSSQQLEHFFEVFEGVCRYREGSKRSATKKLSTTPMLFAERRHVDKEKIFVPQILSERREYVTGGLLSEDTLVIAPHMQIIGGKLYDLAILSSKLHHIWVSTVCGRLKNDIRYSSLLGWNTFPVPPLPERDRFDLARCAEEILLAREAHFPATIADLYDPERMPQDLRRAHERNDETLERIYIGRRFRNDSERLEALFALHTRLVHAQGGRSDGRRGFDAAPA